MLENQNERNDVNAKTIEVNAKTVDEAIELGLVQLGLAREQVDIEIISEGKRGVFGLGSEEAHVRLRPKEQSAGEYSNIADVSLSDESVFPEETSPVTDFSLQAEASSQQQSVEEVAVNYLTGLLERMGIRARVTTRMAPELVESDEEPPLVLDVKGKDLGILIGRRSETLQVLQYMVRLMVSKHFNRWQPVVVDVESYRVRRRHSLSKMAQKMAERAVATGRRVVLEAMPAHERRLIHLALRNHPKVFTKSVGSEDNRKVTIVPK
jgi:spoIIIJ-associated protein